MPPRSALVDLAKNPVPGGATVGLFPSFDGRQIRFATWLATRAPLRGTMIVVPGRTEFIEKYLEVVADLRRRGFAVAVLDLRGQGGSERLLADAQKGHVRSFRDYDRDIERFMTAVVQPTLPPPYMALGHSLGGHILLRHALGGTQLFERMVLSAPMIRISEVQIGRIGRSARAIVEASALFAGGRYVPGGGPFDAAKSPFEGNLLTSDRERFERAYAVLAEAPDLAIGAPTIGWMRAAFRSMAALQHPDTPRRIRVPILFFCAGEDRIVSTLATEEFAQRTKLGSRVLLPTSRHEILMETDDIRARFWAAFDAYLADAAAAA
jgi:lysophospholipase